MIAAHGEDGARDWAQGIKDNMARDPQGGDTDQIRAVAAGECDFAVANHYYYMRLVTSDDAADKAVADAVRFITPNQDGRGVHVNISGAGEIATAPNMQRVFGLSSMQCSVFRRTKARSWAKGSLNQFGCIRRT